MSQNRDKTQGRLEEVTKRSRAVADKLHLHAQVCLAEHEGEEVFDVRFTNPLANSQYNLVYQIHWPVRHLVTEKDLEGWIREYLGNIVVYAASLIPK